LNRFGESAHSILQTADDMKNLEKNILFQVVLLYLLFSSNPALAQDDRGIKLKSNRYALVIGNSSYPTAPLKNPINDAEDIAANLRQLDFKVILKRNADQRTMEDTIRDFGNLLRNGGVGIFYFAGHGIQVGGRNYLIPIDARIETESDVKYEAVDAGRVLGKMEDAGNRLNIVILDACRNNPFARAFRSTQTGLARMDAPAGSLIAYATAPGEVAADGSGRNGLFTKYIIKYMMSPDLPIEQMLKRVRIDVSSETQGKQIPWESSSLMGDFYFNSKKTSDKNRPSYLSATDEDQKTTLAAIPGKKEEIGPSDSKLKLAVFPFYKHKASFFNTGVADPEKEAVLSLSKILSTSKLFITVYSYYAIGGNIKSKMIDDSIMDGDTISDLWIRNGFSSGKIPNIDLICQLGQKMEVDRVLMYSFLWDDQGHSWDTYIYIIDVKVKKSYSKTDSFSYMGLHHGINTFTEKFFAAYENEN